MACACGCGGEVVSPSARFISGHNSRLRGRKPKPICRGCGRPSNTNWGRSKKPVSFRAEDGSYTCSVCIRDEQRRESESTVALTCTRCGSRREIDLRRAKAQARKNKYLDLGARSTLCSGCAMKGWHERYKKRRGKDAHRMMLEGRMRHARRSMPTMSQVRARSNAAVRGSSRSPDQIVRAMLGRSARHLRGEFFLCAVCGKLANRSPSTQHEFGRGCLRKYRTTREWGVWINKRRVDKQCEPPWHRNRSRRSPATLKADLEIYLHHYVLRSTVAEIANEQFLTERAVKKAIQRCKEILPDQWGHVFHLAQDPLRSSPTRFS
jgi:hypothetical protein